MGLRFRSLLLAGSLLAVALPASAQLYRDPHAPIAMRVDDLVGRMTLDEKVRQLQNAAPGIERLGVLPYDWWNEALHGVARAGEATVFPQAIGMAATWDRDLFLKEGQVIALEGRARFNQAQREGNYARYFGLTFWSPNINIFRDPRWGRGQETLGEDPYLTGTLAVPFIRGIQGDNPKYFAAIATPKHFAVHSGPEPLRHGFNVNPSRRDLWETYLPAFRQSITEGHAYSLMCAYNAIDGKPACASGFLLQEVLRKDWGFTGFVTSDCGAIIDITTGHKFIATNAEGAALSIKAGTDTGCNFRNEYLDLPDAVAKGLVSEAEIDIALKRLFTARMRLGMFDPPEMVPFSSIPITENHSPAHRALALRAARSSIVLLKNNGILPLAKGRRIAVIGPSATSLIGLEGNYNGAPVGAVLPFDGMAAQFGAGNVTFAQGSPFVEELAVPIPRTAFGSGLKLEFFAGTEFKGPAIATRTEREIENNWNAIAPAPGVDPGEFSARWTGAITPPAPGDYEFRLDVRGARNSSDGFVMRIEGAGEARSGAVGPAVAGQDSGDAAKSFKVHFDDTRPRAFTLEYVHKSPRFGPAFSISWKAPVAALRDEALRTAANADVIVVFAGLSAWLEGEEMPLKVPGFDGGDRTDIALPEAQADLIAALQATGKPVIIVLQSGSAVSLGALGEKAAGVIEAWYPGEAGGTAIAEILSGAVNPSGRLPVTFYKSAADLPPFGDYSMAGRTYRYFPGAVEYAFGHGLSYTSYAYSDLKLAPGVAAGKPLTVQVRVRNAGKREGDEVAQLYLSSPGREGAPIRSLKGFQRVHLKPGESRTLTFRLTPRDLALADDQGVMRIEPGAHRLWVGGGQPGTGAPGVASGFSTTGSLALPR
ncbi:glycoside hydrolase family 3 C-terminal domain-containing protein [Sphingomonas sp. LB-2]|uniref:glycoside hydrolase family 3 C-terminal domain-containing protein n=1 Tax=Sphingomonas caeni TaxID=2984949 RepID=UPI0022310CD3|nr:glycoside hydrolase family 3 C-terminal domain-containing protein [Sphingomonas caeni]MCW3846583.1 glycoside hydrolase family 3 C-terminal domain-containing protein [Sphingomonas caeni]